MHSGCRLEPNGLVCVDQVGFLSTYTYVRSIHMCVSPRGWSIDKVSRIGMQTISRLLVAHIGMFCAQLENFVAI